VAGGWRGHRALGLVHVAGELQAALALLEWLTLPQFSLQFLN
jgi:hypothetical protein